MRRSSRQDGAIVLFVLFVCLAVAILVQTLAAVVLSTERGVAAEVDGRVKMDQKDQTLAGLRGRLAADWRAMPWFLVEEAAQTEAAVTEMTESGGHALRVSVRQPGISPITVSAWAERGRDGVDLPLAAVVGGSVTWTPGRASPWLFLDPEGALGEAALPWVGELARFRDPPSQPLVGPGVSVTGMADSWRLDDVWNAFFQRLAMEHPDQAEEGEEATREVVAGQNVQSIRCDGGSVDLPEGWGSSADAPSLVVTGGGGTLDARGRGHLYGVIVADGGDLLLDGTVLHGAVFATGAVDFGEAGAVAFSRSILRWATDRSLVRTRLVPGTRVETIE